MKILVTGATGFIGKEIVSELIANNFEVFQLGRQLNKFSQLYVKSQNSDNIFGADITDYKNLLQLEKIGVVDAVIHSAGLAHQFSEIDPAKFVEVNVQGTKNILELMLNLKARHFILISSTAVYGVNKGNETERASLSELVLDENAVCMPETAYAESKLLAEESAMKFCEKNNIPLTILRLAPVIGEANTGNVARLIETIDSGKFVWVGRGQNLKSLIYKKDVARACYEVLLKKKNETEIFNLASEPIRMKEFVSIISRSLGRTIPGISIPPFLINFAFAVNSKFFKLKKINRLAKTVEKWLSDDVYSANKIAEAYQFFTETPITIGLEKQLKQYKTDKKK